MKQLSNQFFSYPSEKGVGKLLFLKQQNNRMWIWYSVSLVLTFLFLYFILLLTKNQEKTYTQNEVTELKIQRKKIPVDINSFVVPIHTNEGIEPNKIDVKLNLSNYKVKNEVKESINTIRRHLIFILSERNKEIFNNIKEKQLLEEEIKNQLNLFLLAGAVNDVHVESNTIN